MRRSSSRNNTLTLAVAGAGKTTTIIRECQLAPQDMRILVLTYTTTNQEELRQRLHLASPAATVEVMGWFSFLIVHCSKPYLPLLFDNQRIESFNFKSEPSLYAKDASRYFDSSGGVYRQHLAELACKIITEPSSGALDRLSKIYDRIYIDEVQDLGGYDLEIIDKLMKSPIELHMVGDVRQALLATNPRERKHKKYRNSGLLDFYRIYERKGTLTINHLFESHRYNQRIADFADTIFPDTLGLPKTTSLSRHSDPHEGVFALPQEHISRYVKTFKPELYLRSKSNLAKGIDLPFMNYGVSKGLTVDRVIIHPTKPIIEFIQKGTPLKELSAAGFYIAATRARHSVAIILDNPHGSSLQIWEP